MLVKIFVKIRKVIIFIYISIVAPVITGFLGIVMVLVVFSYSSSNKERSLQACFCLV